MAELLPTTLRPHRIPDLVTVDRRVLPCADPKHVYELRKAKNNEES